MACLKTIEAFVVLEEVISETVAPSEVMNTGVTCINFNLIFEDDFNCTTLNHISPTPNQSPKHTSLPENEPTDVQNHLVEFSHSK